MYVCRFFFHFSNILARNDKCIFVVLVKNPPHPNYVTICTRIRLRGVKQWRLRVPWPHARENKFSKITRSGLVLDWLVVKTEKKCVRSKNVIKTDFFQKSRAMFNEKTIWFWLVRSACMISLSKRMYRNVFYLIYSIQISVLKCRFFKPHKQLLKKKQTSDQRKMFFQRKSVFFHILPHVS